MPCRNRIKCDFLSENTFPEVVAENLGIMTRQQMEELLVKVDAAATALARELSSRLRSRDVLIPLLRI